MSSYATPSDLTTYGLPAAAFLNSGIDATAQQKLLDSASNFADGFLRAAFELPLVQPYPSDLTEAVCKIAAYNLLSVRGFDPESGADKNVRDRYEDALHWLKEVRDQRVTPSVKDSEPGGTMEAQGGPFVITPQSVTDDDGVTTSSVGTPVRRGW